jgi:oligopeptidase B
MKQPMSNKMCLAFACGLSLVLATTSCKNDKPSFTDNEPTMYQKQDLQAPIAEKIAYEMEKHGDKRVDNYYWMKLTDEQKNATEPDVQTKKVLAYLNAENDYKDKMLSHTTDFQDKLYNEIVGRIKQDDESVPYKDNGYFYYVRYEEGKEYPIHCRKQGSLDAKEEVMLDVNEMAKGHSYMQVSGISVSPDNKILAYGVDTLSRRIYTIYFKNLETGETLADAIPGTTSGVAWANDNKTLFYTAKDPVTLRSDRIFRHVLGSPKDKEMFHEKDDTFGTYVYRSKSGEYIFIGSYSTLANEYRFLRTDQPEGAFTIIEPRPKKGEKLEYSVAHFGDKFYVLTNWQAENFRLMATPIDRPSKENWQEIVAHRPDVLLEDMEIFKNYLVLSERTNGITELRIMPWSGEGEHYIKFDEASHLAYPTVNRDFDTDMLRFDYTSLTTPVSTYDYNMKTKSRELKKQQAVISDTFKPENYASERVYASAKDGTKIPISIVYKKGTKKDGQAPLLLYAYGSYGNSMDPYFSSVRLSLLDRGFIFAIAHIRGGSEMGRQWYENGKMFKKVNTFTDYIDCAQFVIDQKYTNKDKLFAMGGSAGGLLMGAVVNMRPDLFKGVVAAVPFVDVLTTMLDDSIPLTTGEYDEWGNPNNKDSYDYMKSYSPYDQVKAQDYPAMLVTTGLFDSQVQYWEPAKWVAKLRDMKTDKNPLLLYTNMSAGHGGASGRFERYKETALEYTFMLDLVNIHH